MAEILWQPSEERKKNSNMTRFMECVNTRHGQNLISYDALYAWSIDNIATFWADMWEFGAIKASQGYDQVVTDFSEMLKARWFAGAKLNFAENLLRFRDDHTAIIFKGENCEAVQLSYAELYDQVARLAKSLRQKGVVTGDRVAGLMPNLAETVVAMLAAISIGAIWSSCSPDFGINGVMDRFGQIQPKILFSADGYRYNGRSYDSLAKVAEIVNQISSIEQVIVVPYLAKEPDISALPQAVLYQTFLTDETCLEIEFAQLPFNHPVYIMYSSGTTGVPKCIVHSGGGTLIQHLKEHMLHTDLKREDVIFYYTTCGWMMWNWLVSCLAVGTTLLLYDGSPTYPGEGELWQVAQDVGVTVFGTSAKYLASIEKLGLKPGSDYDLSKLKTILSTGSPLSEESYHYVYQDIKQNVCLASITGGTDIVSTFALGNPLLPVRAGELQCRGLGMKVEAFDADANSLLNQKGDLVCTAAFPAMPIYFWQDPDNLKYRKAYFDVYPNVWRHGDYIEITSDGGVIVFGRSDATLNPGGVRIGTAEIYRQVESLSEVVDSLVVGQDWDNDVRMILFVKLAPGLELSEGLIQRIKTVIRVNTTLRHVPAIIIQVKDIPYTLNGKKVEMAVRQIIQNESVLNREALANPESLELFKDLQALQTG